MSLLQKLQDKLLPYIEDEKENYNRSLKYLKRCSTVAILSLSLLIILFLYVKLYHRPTHPLHTSTIHETTFKRTFKSNPTSPIYHTAHDINPHLLCSLPTDQSGHHIRNKTYASFLSNPTSPIYHTAHDINPHLLCSLPTDQSGHHIRNKTYA
eukprot:696116_1